jgi:hypothetical protein
MLTNLELNPSIKTRNSCLWVFECLQVVTQLLLCLHRMDGLLKYVTTSPEDDTRIPLVAQALRELWTMIRIENKR